VADRCASSPGQLGRRALGRWRAGPVAGHGLRLRKLRLRGVSRATRPSIVFARPGSIARVAVRECDCLRDRSSCAGPVRPALRPSDAAAVVCLRIGEPPGSLAVSSQDDTPPLDATARDHRCASGPPGCCLHADARVRLSRLRPGDRHTSPNQAYGTPLIGLPPKSLLSGLDAPLEFLSRNGALGTRTARSGRAMPRGVRCGHGAEGSVKRPRRLECLSAGPAEARR
jgi:hypothetical protein